MTTPTVTTRRPIRVLFANCPRLNVAACAYLILAQNSVQEVFEFEVYRLCVKAEYQKVSDWQSRILRWCSNSKLPFRRFASRRYSARIERLTASPLANVLPLNTCADLLRPLVVEHNAWLEGLPGGYGNWTLRPGPTLIVTETPIQGGYLGSADQNNTFAVITLAEWDKQEVPTSVLEYVLGSVQRYALRLAVSNRIGTHYPTRACVWDFSAHQPDAAMATLVGYLCEACQRLVLETASQAQLTEIQRLLSHTWIGRTEEPGSVASNLKRAFSYDLARTRGMRTTFLQQLHELIPQQVVSLAGVGLVAVASTAFTLFVLWLRGKFGLH